MDQKCDRLYPGAPLEKILDLEQQLEKKLNDVNSFKNSINNIKEMVTHFKDKNNKSEKRYKNFKTLNTILESVDTFLFIGATSTSIILWIFGIGLIFLPISVGITCILSLGNKALHKLIINKCNKEKKQYEKDQQTIKSFDNFHRKSSKYKVIDKNEYETLCKTCTKILEKVKIKSFL